MFISTYDMCIFYYFLVLPITFYYEKNRSYLLYTGVNGKFKLVLPAYMLHVLLIDFFQLSEKKTISLPHCLP